MRAFKHACATILLLWAASGWTQTGLLGVEQGSFNLHKFEQLIGKETYTMARSDKELVLKSDFKFTDRGSPVPLTATLVMEPDLTPREFQIKGNISRFSSIEN